MVLPILIIVLGLATFTALIIGLLYFATPSHLRRPKFEHLHFRTQIVVDGRPINFAEKKYQTPYDTSSCSIDVADRPFHFHDNTDQMTHIHWSKVTGGEFLKYYGWNYIGGPKNSLGRRFDVGFFNYPPITTFGTVLPEIRSDFKFYVFVGNENTYQEKSWNDFLTQDFETFFDKRSNIQKVSQKSLLDTLVPSANAHGGLSEHEESEPTKQKLEKINNLIGNVVIFVQKEKPTDKQVSARFDKLLPLKESTCGG